MNYLCPSDFLTRPTMETQALYYRSRGYYSAFMSEATGVSPDAAYANQSVGVYGNMYCLFSIINGVVYAQFSPEDVLAVDNMSLIRSL